MPSNSVFNAVTFSLTTFVRALIILTPVAPSPVSLTLSFEFKVGEFDAYHGIYGFDCFARLIYAR